MSGDLLKVLYCSFDVIPEPTGSSARATELIRALSSALNADGLTVKTADHPHIERYYGMRLMRVPVGTGELPVRAQAFERAVRRQLESDEYHVVHFTDPFGGYALCELKSQYNFKLVYEVVGFPSIEVKYTHPQLEGDRRLMARLRRQELFCLMNADAVVVGSDVTAAMVQGLGVPRERITVIPTPVDLAPYAGADMPPPDRVPMRVVYIGSQTSWQGLSTLLFSLPIVARSCEVRLAIVGPQHPSFRLQLEEMIKHRRVAHLVEFIDPVPPDELPRVLASADVGVAPLEKSERTAQQGAPVAKIAHYLAAGRPVVASDLPMLREITSDSFALYHRPGDETELAQCLVELANDPARRVAMGDAARAFARERLTSERGREALLKLYSNLLATAGLTLNVPDSAPAAEQVAADAPTSIGAVDAAKAARREADAATQTHIELFTRSGVTDPLRKALEAASDPSVIIAGVPIPDGEPAVPFAASESGEAGPAAPAAADSAPATLAFEPLLLGPEAMLPAAPPASTDDWGTPSMSEPELIPGALLPWDAIIAGAPLPSEQAMSSAPTEAPAPAVAIPEIDSSELVDVPATELPAAAEASGAGGAAVAEAPAVDEPAPTDAAEAPAGTWSSSQTMPQLAIPNPNATQVGFAPGPEPLPGPTFEFAPIAAHEPVSTLEFAPVRLPPAAPAADASVEAPPPTQATLLFEPYSPDAFDAPAAPEASEVQDPLRAETPLAVPVTQVAAEPSDPTTVRGPPTPTFDAWGAVTQAPMPLPPLVAFPPSAARPVVPGSALPFGEDPLALPTMRGGADVPPASPLRPSPATPPALSRPGTTGTPARGVTPTDGLPPIARGGSVNDGPPPMARGSDGLPPISRGFVPNDGLPPIARGMPSDGLPPIARTAPTLPGARPMGPPPVLLGTRPAPPPPIPVLQARTPPPTRPDAAALRSAAAPGPAAAPAPAGVAAVPEAAARPLGPPPSKSPAPPTSLPGGPLTPPSGTSASDEWLGHLLHGYAPFEVPVTRRAVTGEYNLPSKPKPSSS